MMTIPEMRLMSSPLVVASDVEVDKATNLVSRLQHQLGNALKTGMYLAKIAYRRIGDCRLFMGEKSEADFSYNHSLRAAVTSLGELRFRQDRPIDQAVGTYLLMGYLSHKLERWEEGMRYFEDGLDVFSREVEAGRKIDAVNPLHLEFQGHCQVLLSHYSAGVESLMEARGLTSTDRLEPGITIAEGLRDEDREKFNRGRALLKDSIGRRERVGLRPYRTNGNYCYYTLEWFEKYEDRLFDQMM